MATTDEYPLFSDEQKLYFDRLCDVLGVDHLRYFPSSNFIGTPDKSFICRPLDLYESNIRNVFLKADREIKSYCGRIKLLEPKLKKLKDGTSFEVCFPELERRENSVYSAKTGDYFGLYDNLFGEGDLQKQMLMLSFLFKLDEEKNRKFQRFGDIHIK